MILISYNIKLMGSHISVIIIISQCFKQNLVIRQHVYDYDYNKYLIGDKKINLIIFAWFSQRSFSSSIMNKPDFA